MLEKNRKSSFTEDEHFLFSATGSRLSLKIKSRILDKNGYLQFWSSSKFRSIAGESLTQTQNKFLGFSSVTQKSKSLFEPLDNRQVKRDWGLTWSIAFLCHLLQAYQILSQSIESFGSQMNSTTSNFAMHL